MKLDIAAGDWIVYKAADTRHASGETGVLGGPWRHGKLTKPGVDGWTIKNAAGGETFVMARDIVAATLSRGEAILLIEKLAKVQQEYIRERDTLTPRFQEHVNALLNA